VGDSATWQFSAQCSRRHAFFQTVQTAAKEISFQLVVSPHHFQERPGVAVNLIVRETSDMQPAFCGSHVACLNYVCGLQEFPNPFNLCSPNRVEEFFSDLVNLVRIVTFGKQYVGYNVIQACCMGNHCLLETFNWEAW
jgi:hypothetical protein